ncbi:nucleotidyltransferase domain-containing protein [Pseudonocardia sp. TRM90224]|uniref:nucleotidyltransferase domain-containing protein n=1 Tax=Pseudonocardia sp. TRM90224 TaxID=2812678 RepID=UPI001E40974A|nr:nucleotidyltransferase domain-containing protein [Pseudonocardia sp. TRM90224]
MSVTAARRAEFEQVVSIAQQWAETDGGIVALGLAGSWARGAERMSSDVDVVVLTDAPGSYASSTEWLGPFGDPPVVRTQRWGVLIERRVRLESGFEIEFGFVTPDWASTDPVDAGTHRVVSDGMRPLHDPAGLLARVNAAVRPGSGY